MPPTGHTECVDSYVSPTCNSDGCTEGADVTDDNVYDHIVVVDQCVDPTCYESGLTEGSHCSVCGEIIVAQDIVPIVSDNSLYNSNEESTSVPSGNTVESDQVDVVVVNEDTIDVIDSDETSSDIFSDVDEASASETTAEQDQIMVSNSAIEALRIIVSILVPLISKIWFLPFMSFW